MGVRMGTSRIVNVKINIVSVRFITFIWSCTNSLIPKTNGLLLSYKSRGSRAFIHGA